MIPREIIIPIKNNTNSKKEFFKNLVQILSPVFKTTERENELLIYLLEEIELYLSKGYNLSEALKLTNSKESRRKITEKMGFQSSIYRQMIWKLRSKKILGQEINDPHPLYLQIFTLKDIKDSFNIRYSITLPKTNLKANEE